MNRQISHNEKENISSWKNYIDITLEQLESKEEKIDFLNEEIQEIIQEEATLNRCLNYAIVKKLLLVYIVKGRNELIPITPEISKEA